MDEIVSTRILGHVRITSCLRDGSDPIVHCDKKNAVHKENMSVAIARAMSGSPDGQVYTLNFGTGGATIDSLEQVVYASPNVEGSAADLNTPVYQEAVDATRGAPAGNSMSVLHVVETEFSDLEIRCVLDKTEPAGQANFDNVSQSMAGQFTFDELGVKTRDGLLLTHFVFNPIQKTSNRIMTVVYTLRFAIV